MLLAGQQQVVAFTTVPTSAASRDTQELVFNVRVRRDLVRRWGPKQERVSLPPIGRRPPLSIRYDLSDALPVGGTADPTEAQDAQPATDPSLQDLDAPTRRVIADMLTHLLPPSLGRTLTDPPTRANVVQLVARTAADLLGQVSRLLNGHPETAPGAARLAYAIVNSYAVQLRQLVQILPSGDSEPEAVWLRDAVRDLEQVGLQPTTRDYAFRLHDIVFGRHRGEPAPPITPETAREAIAAAEALISPLRKVAVEAANQIEPNDEVVWRSDNIEQVRATIAALDPESLRGDEAAEPT